MLAEVETDKVALRLKPLPKGYYMFIVPEGAAAPVGAKIALDWRASDEPLPGNLGGNGAGSTNIGEQ